MAIIKTKFSRKERTSLDTDGLRFTIALNHRIGNDGDGDCGKEPNKKCNENFFQHSFLLNGWGRAGARPQHQSTDIHRGAHRTVGDDLQHHLIDVELTLTGSPGEENFAGLDVDNRHLVGHCVFLCWLVTIFYQVPVQVAQAQSLPWVPSDCGEAGDPDNFELSINENLSFEVLLN